MKRITLAFTLLIITASAISQTNYYVNDNSTTGDVFTTAAGNDLNAGTAAAPFATLLKAYNTAVAGDIIYVDAGTYATANISVSKALTILGPNYNISPLDATRMEYNTSRNAEANINGSSITVGASNIVIKGLVFSPGAKIQISKGNNGLSFSNVTIAKNGFLITSNQGAINIFGNSASPAASTNYTIEDNAFVQQGTLGVQSITFNAIDGVTITNNSFLNDTGPFTQTAIHLGAGALVSNITINNNLVDEPFTGIFSNLIGNITLDNNRFLGCFNATAIRDANVASGTITLKNNYYRINRSNDGFVVQLIGNTTAGSVKRVVVENNTLDINATGFPNSSVGYLYAQCNAGVVNAEYQGRKNVINITGDLTGYSGFFFTMRCNGKFNAVNIDSNEIYFNATNLSTSSNAYGIVVNLNTGVPNLPPPGSTINITHNKVSGFGRAVQFLGGTLPGVTCNINENSLINNRDLAIVNGNQISPSMNATCNWYGFTSAQLIASKIFSSTPGAVNYTPWLINGTDNEPLTIGFQPVPGFCTGTIPIVTLNSTTDVSCNGGNNGAINITPSSGTAPYSFAWTKDGDLSFSSTNEDLTNLTAGTYRLTMTDQNGSTANLSAVITQPTLLTADAIGANNLCFDQTNGSASVTAGGGTPSYTYLWNNNETTSSISNLSAGIYSVTVTDTHGCTATAEYEVTEPTQLTATPGGSNISCFGGSNGTASVFASGGTEPYTYLWSNNETTDEITNLSIGIYSVTVTDANGCTAQTSYEVIQPTQLTAVATGTSTSCANSATVAPSGGTSPYNYLWNNGATIQSITSLPAGTYTVTVTDDHGCQTTASCTVTASEAFNPSASVTNVSCYGNATGSITVTNANGTAPFQYSIDGINFQSSNVFNNLAAGTYTITVKDANGCTGFVTKTISQPTQLLATLNTVQSTCYGLSTGSITVNVSGGSPAYSYHWTGPNSYSSTQLNISNLATGNYSLTVTDKNLCTATLNVVVPSFNQIIVNSTVNNIACKGETTGSVILNVTGGTGNFSYLWNNGATTSSISNLSTGNYSVNITDIGSGCAKTGNFTITQPSTSVNLSANASNPAGCNSLGSITATGSGGTPPYQYKLDNGGYQFSGSFTGLYAGSYTVWVKDANGCTKSLVKSITDNGSDEYENNNSKNQSKTINVGTSISARIALATDVADWFKFTTGNAGNYNLIFNHPTASFTFNMYPAGNNAAALVPVNSTANSKEYSLAANTTYYIGVTGGLSYVCYQLSVSAPLIPGSAGNNQIQEVKNEEKGMFDVKVFGNPSSNGFILQTITVSNLKMIMRVTDINGRIIEGRQGISPNGLIRLGETFKAGIYFAEIKQGMNKKVIKLIKM